MLSVSKTLALVATVATAWLQVQADSMATCYSPMHSKSYPLNGGEQFTKEALTQSMHSDFDIMNNYFSYVRTFYSQFMGIDVAPIAAAHGIKLYLGVYMTSESWQKNEIEAAVRAVKEHPDSVEAIMVGNENLIDFKTKADDILAIVSQIKAGLGGDAAKVKFGTVQRITEYAESKYDAETKKLAENLDVLGVNIYPFFDNSYNPDQPDLLLNTLWEKVAAKFPADKLRLTETGYATGGQPTQLAPKVKPDLELAKGYYNAVRQWTPQSGCKDCPKFYFQMFDRRPDDNTMHEEVEKHFGFFTSDQQPKAADFPVQKTGGPAPTPAPQATTASPQTGAPNATAPATGVPGSTQTPPTGAPATGTPPTGVPATGTPSTGAPNTQPPVGKPSPNPAAQTGVPPTGAPSTGVPPTGAPATGSPATGAPNTQPPVGKPSPNPAAQTDNNGARSQC